MKHWIASLAALAAALPMTFAPLVLAGDGERHEVVVLKLATAELGDDAVELDVSDLEVGESRSVWTDSGKEVVFTRTEEGHTITVDGEELDLPRFATRHATWLGEDGEAIVLGDGENTPKIRMLRLGHGAHGESIGDRLLASGVLDTLDEVTRNRILDELAEITRHPPVHAFVVRSSDGDSDDGDVE